MKVLIVEDDLALSDVLSFTLRRAGFETTIAHDGVVALERWETDPPDLIILDLNLPKLDGLSVCRRIRAQNDTPIIILSVRSEDEDIVAGLDLGADDYVVKPFSPRQLVARIEAVLRRASNQPICSGPITIADLTLEPSRLELWCGQHFVTCLTRLECRLLEVLMCNKGQVVPADCLVDNVWGAEGGNRAMLKQLVYRLRRKIEVDASYPNYLVTVPGVGYAFAPTKAEAIRERKSPVTHLALAA